MLTGLTTNLRETWDYNDFVIVALNAKSKKKQSEAAIDILLAVKYEKSKTKMIFKFDKQTNRSRKNIPHINYLILINKKYYYIFLINSF